MSPTLVAIPFCHLWYVFVIHKSTYYPPGKWSSSVVFELNLRWRSPPDPHVACGKHNAHAAMCICIWCWRIWHAAWLCLKLVCLQVKWVQKQQSKVHPALISLPLFSRPAFCRVILFHLSVNLESVALYHSIPVDIPNLPSVLLPFGKLITLRRKWPEKCQTSEISSRSLLITLETRANWLIGKCFATIFISAVIWVA